jgi:Xaa-Pro aminopeptidase
MARSDTLLIVADSERDADLLYATGFFAADPFIYLRMDGQPHIIVSDFEVDRARRVAVGCDVLPWSNCRKLLEGSRKKVHFASIIKAVLKDRRLKRVLVPGSFPVALAKELRRQKLKVKISAGSIFPTRENKSAAEVKKISAALTMAEVGLSEGIQALRRAKVGRGGLLQLQTSPLTSERLRGIMETAILQAGGQASRTIVSGGRQTCDPHERGSGPLKANEPILLDVFPRSQKTGYYGDITRTVVKGRASEPLRKMFATVKTGQAIALGQLRDGARCGQIHQSVADYFQREGYTTAKRRNRMEGFFHGLGHGLGLELHEAPRLGEESTDTLRTGHVVAVEPGLYYPGVGGVRLEDVVLVEAGGHRNLTKFEKVLEV